MTEIRNGVDIVYTNDHDSSLYKEIMNLHSEVRQARPCCSPTKFDSVVITVLRDEDQLMTQTLSDIIVDRCDYRILLLPFFLNPVIAAEHNTVSDVPKLAKVKRRLSPTLILAIRDE
uniref:TGF-beta family profile domain-containing protein n=1 Tax=Romanomermis culicivorax TaxID=13658 RepID=A0A915K8H6_ROMCU